MNYVMYIIYYTLNVPYYIVALSQSATNRLLIADTVRTSKGNNNRVHSTLYMKNVNQQFIPSYATQAEMEQSSKIYQMFATRYITLLAYT